MKKIKKIKDGLISRQLSIAKIALKTGTNLYRSRNKNPTKMLTDGLEGQLETIVEELGLMKGSLMKAGQSLSVYAGGFLPEKLQILLSKLESETNYLSWEVIGESVPKKWREDLDISPAPMAAASIGQVHLAKKNDHTFAMKIQYAGVRKAIKNDLKSLKFLLKTLKIFPKEMDLDAVFKEIKTMLELETDYIAEAKNTRDFKRLLAQEPSFVVPDVLNEYSNDKILTTEFIVGLNLREIPKDMLDQEKRDKLGKEFMRLLFLELFVFEKIQSDVHLGNYLITDIESEPKWGLIDFGATKTPDKDFIKKYRTLIIHLANNNKDSFLESFYQMGYISQIKETNINFLWEYAELIGEPFHNGVYDWGASDIADRVFKSIPKLIKEISVGNPPSESIFLDRKIGGVYFVLQQLGARFDPKEVLSEFTHNI